MRILTVCDTQGSNIARSLGTPDYSYHFVQEAFHAALTGFAHVQRIDAAQDDVDRIWGQCRKQGEDCILLSFAPPHRTPLGLRCPTLPVFAWEYPNLPAAADEESWNKDPRSDWRKVLLQCAGAITLSVHTADAVRDGLGSDYPVLAVPTPLWEKYARQRLRGPLPSHRAAVEICMDAIVVDSDMLGLSADALLTDHPEDATPSHPDTDTLLPALPSNPDDAWPSEIESSHAGQGEVVVPEGLAEGRPAIDSGWDLPPAFSVRTRLRGVVYTAVITPSDGRKNWEDLITAFTWAFRNVEDATLVLKLGGPRQHEHHCQMLMLLTKMSPMKCRVVAIHGYLHDEAYQQLIGATTYYVNASLCEGLCMPILEFLSCGIPAIAPNHTAMSDYISREFAFVIDSNPDVPALWPHGDFGVYRTHRHQINWHSLMLAYRNSYVLARNHPPAYAAMSAQAVEAMRTYCGLPTVTERLHTFIRARIHEVRAEQGASERMRNGS